MPQDPITEVAEIATRLFNAAEFANRLRQGFSQEELESAFRSVENSEHWKGVIHARITTEALKTVAVAIPYFTATEATFTYKPRSENDETPWVVKAPGYWAGPAN